VPRRICGPKRDKIIGSWRKFHNEELRNLYSSPNTMKMIRLTGHVARIRGMYTGFSWKREKEKVTKKAYT
jgi:hypothetical protein